MRTLTRCLVPCLLALTACVADDTDSRRSPIGDDPVACIEIAVECPCGEQPTDIDGDGCALECAPVACPEIAVECCEGEAPADVDGDGCALECAPIVVCPAVEVDCPPGYVPADTDGDGCALECVETCG